MTLDLYIGIDESNNGKSFEIHTAVSSIYASDASAISKHNLLPKIRNHKNLFSRLRNRGHSFLLFTDSDRHRIPRNERTGVIVSSLLMDEFDWSDFDSFNFLLDGERSIRELDLMLDIIEEKIPQIKRKKTSVSYGGKFDQRYHVVNLADQLAHYLFRKGVDYVSEHKERKLLIY